MGGRRHPVGCVSNMFAATDTIARICRSVRASGQKAPRQISRPWIWRKTCTSRWAQQRRPRRTNDLAPFLQPKGDVMAAHHSLPRCPPPSSVCPRVISTPLHPAPTQSILGVPSQPAKSSTSQSSCPCRRKSVKYHCLPLPRQSRTHSPTPHLVTFQAPPHCSFCDRHHPPQSLSCIQAQHSSFGQPFLRTQPGPHDDPVTAACRIFWSPYVFARCGYRAPCPSTAMPTMFRAGTAPAPGSPSM